MRRAVVAGWATVITIACAMAPANAIAVPTWLAPQGLSESGQNAEFANAAMAPSGAAALAWERYDGSYQRIQMSTRPPFGSFGSALSVSPEKQDGVYPQVAISSGDAATAVWMNVTSTSVVEAATVTAGVASAAVKLSAEGETALYPVLAVDERGDTIVAWTLYNGSNYIVEAAFRSSGGGFSAPVILSAAGENAEYPRVAIDAAGDATVVWQRSNGTHLVVEESTRSASSGSFSAARELSDASEDAVYPWVAMDAAGDTAVVWSRNNGTSYIAQIATRPAGGGFGTPANLSTSGGNAEWPHVALSDSGAAEVTWMRSDLIEVAGGPLGGPYSTPQAIDYPGLFPTVAEDGAGDTVVGFFNPMFNRVYASFKPAGGQFGVPEPVSPAEKQVRVGGPGEEFQQNVAVDGQGNALFGFSAENAAAYYTASQALLDSAGPLLTGLSIPATATAGVPATFSVSPVDQLSAVTGTVWIFGDATVAAGDSVAHTFAYPGTYEVSVVSLDAFENESVGGGVIKVLAPQTPPGPESFAGGLVTSRSVRVNSRGRFQLQIQCPKAFACSGKVTVTASVMASRLALAATSKAHGVAATVTVGAGHFSAKAGGSATVAFTLPNAIFKLLGTGRSLKVSALVESEEGLKRKATTHTEVTVKRAAKKKGKKAKKRGNRH